MARYTQDSRERVRDAVDFEELVGARVELRRSGTRRLSGLCPFHDERTPSFGIDPVEKLYHCFRCGGGGGASSFVVGSAAARGAASSRSSGRRGAWAWPARWSRWPPATGWGSSARPRIRPPPPGA